MRVRAGTFARHNKHEESVMGIMSIIWTIIVGLVVGILARWFYPGAIPMSWWMTALLGIAGSLVGGVVSSLIFRSPGGGFHPAGWILSILGAMVLIWVYLNLIVKS
jgi:uncharacterized membrane protein YeaQ/YmgE (transglycosylase-associated protein family)